MFISIKIVNFSLFPWPSDPVWVNKKQWIPGTNRETDNYGNLNYTECVQMRRSTLNPCRLFLIYLRRLMISKKKRVMNVPWWKSGVYFYHSNKAVGHDGIHAKFLKLAESHLTNTLCNLFNTCVISNCFPSQMKLADITLLFKKDDTLSKKIQISESVACSIKSLRENLVWPVKYFFSKKCWVHSCRPTEKDIIVSMLFLYSPSTSGRPLITAIYLVPWQWTSRRHLIGCRMDC